MMQNIRLLQQIFSERWLIEKSYEQQVAPLILKALLEGQIPDMVNDGQNIRLEASSGDAESYGWRLHVIEENRVRKINTFSEASRNAIALLHVDGPIMRSDGWCSMGTQTMGNIIKGADRSENISAIILETNSPGGQVGGTEQLATAIEQVETPTYTYGHFAASAAYWISAATDQIWSSGRSNEFGSIGTMASWRDYSAYFEELGIKMHEVYATDSIHKNLPFREAQQGNYELIQKEMLDPTNDIFKSEMRKFRQLSEEVLTGKVFLAETALEKGLIDRIGTREDLVKHISATHFSTTTHSFNITQMAEDKTTWRTKLGNMFPNTQALESLNTELQETAADRDDWKAKYDAQQAEITTLKEANTELETQLTAAVNLAKDWESKAEAFGKQPGEFPSAVAKEEGDEIGEDTSFKVDTGAEHNQLAMQILGKKRKR